MTAAHWLANFTRAARVDWTVLLRLKEERKYCQNPNLTSTQQLGFTRKWLYTTHHHRNSMSAISQLLLTRFWWKLKGRFLGTSKTDSRFMVTFVQASGIICSHNIFPYQEYLSCYWPDYDEILKVGSWEHLEEVFGSNIFFIQNFWVSIFLDLSCFLLVTTIFFAHT